MNSTNRGANRLLIFACGLLLLAAGSAAAATVLIPTVRDGWRDAVGQVEPGVSAWLGSAGTSWLAVVVLALLVVAAIVFIARIGRGRSRIAVSEPGEHGSITIDAAVPERAIQDALAQQPELVAVQVSTHNVRRVLALKVSVTCRRGVSPKDAASIVEGRLRALDELLGRELPALILIGGGFRARTTKTTRLQ